MGVREWWRERAESSRVPSALLRAAGLGAIPVQDESKTKISACYVPQLGRGFAHTPCKGKHLGQNSSLDQRGV